jgi:hypothetical protein
MVEETLDPFAAKSDWMDYHLGEGREEQVTFECNIPPEHNFIPGILPYGLTKPTAFN